MVMVDGCWLMVMVMVDGDVCLIGWVVGVCVPVGKFLYVDVGGGYVFLVL